MKNLLLATVVSLLATGCATSLEKTNVQAQGFTVDGASKVVFHDLRVETAANGSGFLRGNLTRLGHDPVYFGHLDYTILDPNGKTLQSGQADYSGAIKQRLPRRPSVFAIPVQQAWQSNMYRATLVWHNKPHSITVKPR